MGRIAKSTQEQAVAAWITCKNQMRLDTLIQRMDQQDVNLEEALKELGYLKEFIKDPAHILGSEGTKHGEIAEHVQVNFENARAAIKGLTARYTFEGVGRTAAEDYLRDGKPVQSKFCNELRITFFSKHAIESHLEKYPDFIKEGGSYDIPRDQYEKLVDILDKYQNSPSQLAKRDYTLAKKLDDFLKKKELTPGKDIRPAVVDYSDVQKGRKSLTGKSKW